MPKKTPLPEYSTDQIVELIRQYIHNKVNRKMLYWRLVDGDTFESILDKVFNEEGIRTVKTVRKRIHEGETELFRHLPG